MSRKAMEPLYRTIDAAFWTDPKVRKLDAAGKLLFLYFITNPHTHVSGLYYAPGIVIQHETGLAPKALNTLCNTLSSLGLVLFDKENELVWVVRMFRYQGSGEKNLRSAANHLSQDVHKSPLVAQFKSIYPEVKQFMVDRVSDTVSEFGTPDPRPLIPEQKQEKEQEQIPLPRFGAFANVKLSPDEFEKLTCKFGGAEALERIERLSEYVASKGVKYRSHYATILSWDRKNGNGGSNGNAHRQFESKEQSRERRQLQTLVELSGGTDQISFDLGSGSPQGPSRALPRTAGGSSTQGAKDGL